MVGDGIRGVWGWGGVMFFLLDVERRTSRVDVILDTLPVI